MSKKTYTGINIQYPISQKILSGEKTVETRTYPLPEKYIGEEMVMIETPGPNGGFKARTVAIIRFVKIFKYSSEKVFYSDSHRHRVTPDSKWAWSKDKPKWGWELSVVKRTKKLSIPNKGIVYTRNINV